MSGSRARVWLARVCLARASAPWPRASIDPLSKLAFKSWQAVWGLASPPLPACSAASLLHSRCCMHLERSITACGMQAPEWSNISVLPGEVLVTGTNDSKGSSSRCDAVVLNPPGPDRGGPITHVLMAGYDTNKCVCVLRFSDAHCFLALILCTSCTRSRALVCVHERAQVG